MPSRSAHNFPASDRRADTVWSQAVPGLIEWLRGNRIEISTVLRGTGLRDDLVTSAEPKVDLSQFHSLWNVAAGINPAVGLQLADRLRKDDFHLINQIMRRCDTLGASMEAGVRYGRLVSEQYSGRLVVEGDEARYFIDSAVTGNEIPQIAEYHLRSLVRLAQEETGDAFRISGVEFSHQKQCSAEEYHAAFGMRPRFGQAQSGISFPRSMLALPMMSFAPHIGNVLRLHADQVLSELDRGQKLPDRVRLLMLRMVAAGQLPTIQGVASQLRLSPSALQRQLREEKASWKPLWDEVRRELTTAKLASGQSVASIADELSYSEPAALHHAIRRWFGKSAKQLRDEMAIGGRAGILVQ